MATYDEGNSRCDGEVVAAVLAGDSGCFRILVCKYESALLRAAMSRLGDRQSAEDAVQEAFLSAFKSMASYDSRYSFRTWLWTILLNQCRRQYRKKLRGSGESADSISDHEFDDELTCSSPAPDEVLLFAERRERLESWLRVLPEAQADALRLRYFGGLKYQEIADAMGCSLSSAKNRVRWGLGKISEMIGALANPNTSSDEY